LLAAVGTKAHVVDALRAMLRFAINEGVEGLETPFSEEDRLAVGLLALRGFDSKI
jgi:hypothetical protein